MNTITENPHFARVDRAPFEIGRLLQTMPEVFSAHAPIEPEHQLLGAAVVKHAWNANQTLLSGIEAIGHVLQVAANNKEWEVDRDHVARLGGLITHLAVEAQLMQELDDGFSAALRAQKERSEE